MEPSDRQGKKREGRREEKRDCRQGRGSASQIENMSDLAERILSAGERR